MDVQRAIEIVLTRLVDVWMFCLIGVRWASLGYVPY